MTYFLKLEHRHLIATYSLNCIKFSACEDTKHDHSSDEFMQEEKKQSEEQTGFGTDMLMCFQSLRAAALSFSVMLMVVLTHWLQRRTEQTSFWILSKEASPIFGTSCRSVRSFQN